jgi:hypothetical protein
MDDGMDKTPCISCSERVRYRLPCFKRRQERSRGSVIGIAAWDSHPGMGKKFSSFSKRPDRRCDPPPQPPIQRVPGFVPGGKAPGP